MCRHRTLQLTPATLTESEYSHSDPKSILLSTSRFPQHAALFNHASMAHNNWFYFQGINYGAEPSELPTRLELAFNKSFNSVDSLKQQFLTTADAMFGPGFVWLVRVRRELDSLRGRGAGYYDSAVGGAVDLADYRFAILSTYAAGSPYAGAHNRLQPVDANNQNAGAPGGLDMAARIAAMDQQSQQQPPSPPRLEQHSTVQNSVGYFGAAARRSTSYGGVELTPILCVNTWPQAWLLDWTVRGKRQFLDAWWQRIDWVQAMRRMYSTDK